MRNKINEKKNRKSACFSRLFCFMRLGGKYNLQMLFFNLQIKHLKKVIVCFGYMHKVEKPK